MKRSLYGFLIVIFGILLLLVSFDIGPASMFLDKFWPLFIIAIGFIQLVGRRQGNWWPFALLVVGCVLLVQTSEIVQFDVWRVLWPGLIILLGLTLAAGGRRIGVEQDTSSEGDTTAFLSGVETSIISEDYTGGKITSIMGGVEIDMSKAIIKQDARINLSVVMGGVELRVPENAVVKSSAMVLLGGIEDKSRPQGAKKSPTIYLDGMIVMGGVEIKR